MNLIDWLCILVISSKFCYAANYTLTNITLEAFEPSGLQASIPADPQIRLFGFHANVNREIDTTEPGDIAGDVTVDRSKTTTVITYLNPSVKISVGDVVYYWIYVQHNFLGYRFEGKWKVTELKKSYMEPCEESPTKVTSRNFVCKNSIVLEDNFEGDFINADKWTVEQYMPRAPDFEFVIYKKDTDVISAKEELLTIKPKLILDDKELNKETLDLSDGCTRTNVRDCKNEIFLIQNPIISGRMVSKVSFQYGDIEIKAKLPSGDWIYPQIYLEGENGQKIVIAYARGNQKLVGSDNIDIGASLLFAGPELSNKEPQRSSKFSSFRGQNPFNKDFHIYRLKWSKDIMEFYIDGNKFGEVSGESVKNTGLDGKPVKLVLGVSVGGINDFPDNFKSGSGKKPWRNGNRLQVKKFYESRNEWYNQTWGDDSQLQIDYVKIRSL